MLGKWLETGLIDDRGGCPGALVRVDGESVGTQPAEDFSKMRQMFFLVVGGDQQVVQVDEHPRQVPQDFVHEPLECGDRVVHSER